MEANIHSLLGSVFFSSKVDTAGTVGSSSPETCGKAMRAARLRNSSTVGQYLQRSSQRWWSYHSSTHLNS